MEQRSKHLVDAYLQTKMCSMITIIAYIKKIMFEDQNFIFTEILNQRNFTAVSILKFSSAIPYY